MRLATFFGAGLLMLCPLAAFGQDQEAQNDPLSELGWITGPTEVAIGRRAKVVVPSGYDALGAADTAALMELMHNPVGSSQMYYVGPADMRWFAVFEFDESGYVKDDEKLDPDEILKSIRMGAEQGNRIRRERGWAEMQIVGWQYKPFYESGSNRLAWAILATSGGEQIINYNTRLLGRKGVMSAILVASPDILDSSVTEFQNLLDGFGYVEGERYAEYKSGDRVAEYGLAALVAGGAAAAVVKGGGKGIFKLFGVAILAGIAAVGGFFKRLFGKD